MSRIINAFALSLSVVRNRAFLLVFLNGFILALLVYFYTEDSYETQIFRALASQVQQTTDSNHPDSLLVSSLNLTYLLEKNRLQVFNNKEIHTLKSDLIRPVTFDLITGNGACGSYSYVLSRILRELNVETRFAQMKVNGKFGGHITVEAKSGNKWVSLDPSYNLMFKSTNGQYASFSEISSNWNYYKNQVPENYDQSYSYDDVQYTNWAKVPLVMPALKKFITLVKGEKAAQEFSIRNLFLRKFDVLFKITLVIYILLTLIFLRNFRKQSEEIENFRLSLMFAKKADKIRLNQKRAEVTLA